MVDGLFFIISSNHIIYRYFCKLILRYICELTFDYFKLENTTEEHTKPYIWRKEGHQTIFSRNGVLTKHFQENFAFSVLLQMVLQVGGPAQHKTNITIPTAKAVLYTF